MRKTEKRKLMRKILGSIRCLSIRGYLSAVPSAGFGVTARNEGLMGDLWTLLGQTKSK